MAEGFSNRPVMWRPAGRPWFVGLGLGEPDGVGFGARWPDRDAATKPRQTAIEERSVRRNVGYCRLPLK